MVELFLVVIHQDQPPLSDTAVNLCNKILVTTSAAFLSVYSGYYSWRLMEALSKTSFKKKLQCKVLMTAVTIQIVLILHTVYSFFRYKSNDHDWDDQPWLWPTFQILYTYLSEIQPFFFFVYIIWK